MNHIHSRRVVDLFGACYGLLFLFPIILVVSIAIVMESGLPVFFRQQRVARHGKLFVLYKFRTMRSVSIQAWIDPSGPRPSRNQLMELRRSFVTTVPLDGRITRVGAILRRFHIDEIPQLFNVLEGDMSLVGPRPDTPIQEIDYSEVQWSERCSVAPGLTGPSQVMGGKELTLRRRIALDLAFIRRRRGLRLDYLVIAQTFISVIKGKSY